MGATASAPPGLGVRVESQRQLADDLPTWFRWLGPWFVVDQTYAIVESGSPPSDDGFREFYLGAAGLLWCTWSASVAIGVVLGPVLPAWLPLEFVLSAMFVVLVVPGLRDGVEAAAAVVGAVSAVALPTSMALPVAACVAALIGLVIGAEDAS